MWFCANKYNTKKYTCVVWHSSQKHEQTEQLNSTQRQALKLIYGGNVDDLSRELDSMPSLAERRGRLTEPYFTSLLKPTNSLCHQIPSKRNSDVTGKLLVQAISRIVNSN